MNESVKYILDDTSLDRLMFMLIGHPLVGKSTFLKENDLDTFDIISRDDLLLEVAGTNDYTEAWSNVDQGKVNIKLKEKINFLSGMSDTVIIDMTNMTPKGRKNHLKKFKNFYKVAVVFPFLDDDELLRRNEKRKEEVNKWIPIGVIDNMKKSFVEPTEDEGFDEIITL